ncbi:MAG: hydantoinase B/oxoprolinase family protein [Gammaproteobacteria bacterium]|nr:hydantoinase B/oxoprolinase family protein [Gammaproteobacteria bacterium]
MDIKARPRIGWGGTTLKEMLTHSEQLLADSGHYYGLRDLKLADATPLLFERMHLKLRGALVSAREIARNISASPIVKELGELAFTVFTPEGDSVALSTGIIVHVHTMSDVVKYMIRNDFEDDPGFAPGDVFCNNDVLAGNVHNCDIHTIIPFFHDGELVSWIAGVTHVPDVGARTPGSSPVGPMSTYDQGLTIPPQKIGENDRVFRAFRDTYKRTSRTPLLLELDEKTRLAGCMMIRGALTHLIREEGIDTYKQFMREAIENGRRSFIRRVRRMLVPGRYRVPSFCDVPWQDERGHLPQAAVNTLMNSPLEITVKVDGTIRTTLDGATAWGYHTMNCSPSALQGGMWVMLSQSLADAESINDGSYFALDQYFPSGSWSNPGNPEAGTAHAWHFLWSGLNGLFRFLSHGYYARGFLEEVVAGYGTTTNILYGSGLNMFGEPFAATNMEMTGAGLGARGCRDGLDCAYAMWNPESDIGDIETSWELWEPMLYLGRTVKPNTGGAGRFRGGNALESVRLVWKSHNAVFQHVGHGMVFVNSGMFGGYPSATGYRRSVHDTNALELIDARAPLPVHDHDPQDSEIERLIEGRHVLDDKALTLPEPYADGDIYVSCIQGGPGLGDPIERAAHLVAQDLNEGHLLARFAAPLYGVIAHQDAGGVWSVDEAATAERRAAMRHERAAGAVPVSQWLARERERVHAGNFAPWVLRMYRESIRLSGDWGREFKAFWGIADASAVYEPPAGRGVRR